MLASMRRPDGDLELVQIVDAALAGAAERAGQWLACRKGCTPCCTGAFAIGALDALRLADGMDELRAHDPARAEAVIARSRAWIAAHGGEFPGDLATGRLGESGVERQRFEDFANEAICPALDPATGACDLYDWRPMTCRVFGPPVRTAGDDGAEGLGHCELCFQGASPEEVAACEVVVPHELEARITEELGPRGETVVACALLNSASQR
jgi:Fe-S-cluster containining protein